MAEVSFLPSANTRKRASASRETGIPLGLTKRENSGGDEGLAILEFGGHGGDEHFRISEGKGGG